MPIAPAAFARSAFEKNVQIPRETSAIWFASDPGGSVVFAGLFGSSAGPHRWRSTGVPSVPTIEPTSVSVWSNTPHDAGMRFGPGWTGIARNDAGAFALVTCI